MTTVRHIPPRVAICCSAIALLLSTSAGLLAENGTGEVALPPAGFREGFDSIDERQAREYISVLAGSDFAGRGTGQAGYVKAAHYVAGKLAEFGWEPIGDNGSYFQHVPMVRISPHAEQSFIGGPDDLKISGDDDLGFTSFGSTPSVTGKVVFINAKGPGLSLSNDVSLQGKVAVVTSAETDSRLIRSLWGKRPAGIVRIVAEKPTSRSRVVRQGANASRSNRIEAVVSEAASEKLTEAVGGDLAWLEPRSDNGIGTNEVDAELTLEVRVREEPLLTPNVVGWFPGSDPDVRHEYVAVGAHLDHLGNRNGSVYPGANDNASGSTAILQIARAIATNPTKPKRSVLFIAFAAEEMGLVGSRYYCEHPIKPMEDMVCMLNMDMVGCNEEKGDEKGEDNENTMHLVGSKKLGEGLHNVVMDANKTVQLEFEYDEERVFRRSDHYSFHQKGVPVAFIFGGFEPRYHKPTDTLENINYRKILAGARLYYLTLMLAADHGHFTSNTEEPTAQ